MFVYKWSQLRKSKLIIKSLQTLNLIAEGNFLSKDDIQIKVSVLNLHNQYILMIDPNFFQKKVMDI